MADSVRKSGEPRQGLFLSPPILLSLLMGLSGLVASYVFVTKSEAKASDERILVLEQTDIHQTKAIEDLSKSVGQLNRNLQTLMLHEGVPELRIELPEDQP